MLIMRAKILKGKWTVHRPENGYLVAELTEGPHEMYQALITVRHGVKLPRLLLEHVQVLSRSAYWASGL